MINLLNIGAVPFGYTIDLIDSEHECDTLERCLINDMNLHNFRSPSGLHHSLPDVILSNTPPASPLRRAHSYNFLFPEKTEGERSRPSHPSLQRALSCLPTPPATPTSPQEGNVSLGVDGDAFQPEDPDVGNARSSLQHIQEVRRSLSTHFDQPRQALPPLSWEVPTTRTRRRTTPPSLPPVGPNFEGQVELEDQIDPQVIGGRATGAGGGGGGALSTQGAPDASHQRLRQIGTDLRRIADQFQIDNGRLHHQER